MNKRTKISALRLHALARSDWHFVFGIGGTALVVAPALVLAPAWRDLILGCAAVTMLLLLGWERARARRRLLRLAEQLRAVASLDKLEVPDDPSAGALDRALNAAIQQTREQARILQFTPQRIPANEALRMFEGDDAPRNVAVLALGLRDQPSTVLSTQVMAQLREIAGTVVAVADRRSALLQTQGSGAFVLIFAAFSQEPAAHSVVAAFEAARELLRVHPELRFGLSIGVGVPCALPGAGYTVIGSPFEESMRLHRLAASWHEYHVLCPEPVALLLRPHIGGHRTHLCLTASDAPPQPVYALEMTASVAQVVARPA